MDDLVRDGREVLAGERLAPRQELVQDDAEREDVAAAVHGRSGDLFRRHVVGRSQELAGRRQVRGGDLRDAEVGDLDLLVGRDDDVGRLDVAVDDPFAVGVVHRLRDLRDHVGDLVPGERGLLDQEALQGLALDVLHRDVGDLRVGVLADVVDRDDVGVREDAGGLRLANEPLAEFPRLGVVVAHLRRADRLDRDHPADDGVAGQVDDPHRTLAELAQHLVAAELREPRSGGALIRHQVSSTAARSPEDRGSRVPR